MMFMSTMLLEKIMTSECSGRPLVLGGTEIPVVVDPSTPRNRLIFKFTLPEDESTVRPLGIDDDLHEQTLRSLTWPTPDDSRRRWEGKRARELKSQERMGNALLDAWEKERGEGE